MDVEKVRDRNRQRQKADGEMDPQTHQAADRAADRDRDVREIGES